MEFETTDLVYTGPGNNALSARIYRPLSKPVAALVEVHGGAWIYGDLKSDSDLCERLAAQCVLVMAIDFRTTEKYPASLADINLAIRWLKRETKELAIPVGGLGTSSGGHQILLSALRPNDSRYTVRDEIDGDAVLDFVIACWPVSDPAARYEYAKEQSLDRLLAAHDAWFPDRATMDDANPLQILLRGEVAKLPPLLIVQGGADENFPPAMSRMLASAWKQRGGVVELHWHEGEPHGFINTDPDSNASRDAIAKIASFVRLFRRVA